MSALTRTVCALFLLSIGTPMAVVAQARPGDPLLGHYPHASWRQFGDLPSSAVLDVAQDKDGYLWIAFRSGLVRFDGVRFVTWKGLPERSVVSLCVSRDGSLWMGFGNLGGVARLRDGHLDYSPSRVGLPEGALEALVEDRDGTLWIGGYSGLSRLRSGQWERVRRSDGNLIGNTVREFYEDTRGNLWASTDTGFLLRPVGSDHFDAVDPAVSRSTTPDAARFLQEMAAGRGSAARDVLRDRDGHFWVAGRGDVMRYSGTMDGPPDLSFGESQGLTSARARALFEDRDGNMWVGTEGGLDLIAFSTPHSIVGLPGIEGSSVSSFAADHTGHLWVATSRGLHRFSPDSRQGSVGKDAPRAVTALHVDRMGTLWAAGSSGITRLSGDRFLDVGPTGDSFTQVVAMTVDPEGAVWLCDATGLRRLKDGILSSFDDLPDVAHRRPSAAFTDRSGAVWIGFWDGHLARFTNGRPRMFSTKDGLSAGRISAIHEDRNGAIWIATLGGFSRFKDGRFITPPPASGIADHMVFSIVADNSGHLWLGTEAGLIRFLASDVDRTVADPLFQIPHRVFGTADGLNASIAWTGSPASVQAPDGTLWFQKAGGVAIIDPAHVLRVPRPPVRIEQVSTDHGVFAPVDGFTVPANASRLEIDYTSTSFVAPSHTRFRYMVEGFDTTWVTGGAARRAVYTNLPPRSYRFRVQASRDDSDWVQATATWSFTVAPAFYETTWFYASGVVATTMGLWLVWTRRIAEERRRFALVLAERTRLGRELHDTLLQGMTAVALQVDDIAETAAAGHAALKNRLFLVRDRLEDSIREARVSIWDLRTATFASRDLVGALRTACDAVTSGTSIHVSLSVSGSPRRCDPRVEEHLLRIGQEAVTNAVRHAHPSHITVEVVYQDSSLGIRIIDDGRGFSPEGDARRPGCWGLVSMRERAQLIGAEFTLASTQAGGTRIEAFAQLSAT